MTDTPGILGDDWELDGARVTISFATPELLAEMDTWVEQRTGASQAGWNWRRLSEEHRECFVASVAGAPVVAFAGPKRGAITVGGTRCYRLDFVEVAPSCRGQGAWGAFALFVAAHRAVELDAAGLIMPALPRRVAWLERLGATRVPKHTWRCERELVGLWITGEAFRILRGP